MVNGNNLGCCRIYQERAPCNQDHYSSLGKNIFISLLKCVFLYLTIGSKRKELGLPIRNRHMAHDYMLAPVLHDNTNYIDWCKELDVWVKLTELPEGIETLAIFLSLRGKAALQLEIKDLKVRGGVIKLKEKLDKACSKDKRRELMMLIRNLRNLSVQMKCL